MWSKSLVNACFLLALVVNCTSIDLGNDDDGSINKYVQQFMLKLQPIMRMGVPDLAIPVLDPLTLDNLVITRVPDGFNTFNATFKGASLNGASSFDFDGDADVDLQNLKLVIPLSFDDVVFEGETDISGATDSANIYDTGDMRLELASVAGSLTVSLERINSTTVKFGEFGLDFNLDSLVVKFSGISIPEDLLPAIGQDLMLGVVEIMVGNTETWFHSQIDQILAVLDFSDFPPSF